MRTNIFILLVALLFSMSCEDDNEGKGICIACCDTNGNEICVQSFTKKMCAERDRNKVNGRNWRFEERDICAPSGPK